MKKEGRLNDYKNIAWKSSIPDRQCLFILAFMIFNISLTILHIFLTVPVAGVNVIFFS